LLVLPRCPAFPACCQPSAVIIIASAPARALIQTLVAGKTGDTSVVVGDALYEVMGLKTVSVGGLDGA
jgi:hypothetical protein